MTLLCGKRACFGVSSPLRAAGPLKKTVAVKCRRALAGALRRYGGGPALAWNALSVAALMRAADSV